MPTKLAIHAGPPITAALHGWETSRSARLNGIVARYFELIRQERDALRFSLDEWAMIVDAMSDAYVEGRDGTDWQAGWSMLINRNSGATGRELGLRIQQMPPVAQCALWEVVAVYWASHATLSVADYLRAEAITATPVRQPQAASL